MTTSQTIWSPRRGYNFKVKLIRPALEDKTTIYDVSAIEDNQSDENRGETPSALGEGSGENQEP